MIAMQKQILTVLVILVLGLSVLSCNKEQILIPEAQEVSLSAEELTNLHIRSDVVLQYMHYNLSTDEESGWVVDKKGMVKAYRGSGELETFEVENTVWNEDRISSLYNSADQLLAEVDLEDLWQAYQTITRVDARSLSETAVSPDVNVVSALFAFRYNPAIQGNATDESCGNQSHDDLVQQSSFDRLLIEASGRIEKHNLSEAGKNLSHWTSITDNDNP